MPVTRANVEATKRFMLERDAADAPYVYGGALSANPRVGTDCSEIWQTALEMVHGRWVPGRQAEGATTESYRPTTMGGPIPIGGRGPLGTIVVARLADIPRDAAARLAFHHGPGGGANSHVWGDLDGLRIESAGSVGVVTGSKARAVEDRYANSWAYLPGPIVDDGTPIPPAPPEVVTLGRRHESVGPRVRALQEALNRNGAALEVDGEFGPMTESAVTAYQRAKGLEIDGVAGPQTLASLGLTFGAQTPTTQPASGRGLTAEVFRRLMDNRISLARAQQLLPGVLQCLRDCGCDTVLRRAMWFAQTGHESDSFTTAREYASGDAYDTRTDLGNTPEIDGDGARYKGRGWIQLTGAGHYRELSRWAHGLGLVPTPTWFFDRPELLEQDAGAFLATRFYWTVSRPQLNALADRSDLVGATRAVNGGTTGLDHRREIYARALAAGTDLLDPTPADEWEALLMSTEPVQSTSHFRRDNAKNATPLQILLGTNAMVHEAQTIDAAYRFEAWAIQELAVLADGNSPGAKDPDGPWWVSRAKYTLSVLYAANKDLVTQALGKAA